MYYNITEYVANHLIFWVCFKQIIPQNCCFFLVKMMMMMMNHEN